MATVVLGIGGQVLGGMLGGPIGAMIGKAVGALAGSMVDQAIISALTPPRHGPRLTSQDIQTSTEGAPITRQIGRVRMPGQIIWATRYEERSETTGGKGTQGPVVVEYSYFGNFAVGLCEGPIAGIGRVWADGKEVDRTTIEMRVYLGTETQEPDPLIEAKEGQAPAYRGLAYVVFEGLPLASYGNRLPQMSFEIIRPVGVLEPMISGVALLPGNEFGFDPLRVDQVKSEGKVPENRNTLVATTDMLESLDRLQFTLPNCSHVLLVVPWYGDDLRVGECLIRPCVDAKGKITEPYDWQVGDETRETARLVSYVNGSAAYGGTPSDASLLRAIAELKRRGLSVAILPFIMMDVPADNDLPNPYGGDSQPPYPWRGRITTIPAPGLEDSPDQTSTITSEVAAFVGPAQLSDFAWAGDVLTYAGADWGYRRFILHIAHLAAKAGGVESFIIGSEMIGLTQLRDSASSYPFVSALVDLADDCRAVLGAGVKLGYAADWSEYNSHRPSDGTGDLYFNLDPIWSSANIDFIGIDNYLPLADWRDGSDHLDYDPAGPISTYDRDYLLGNVRGGEGFDWYYASAADRESQTRTPISDGAYGKPWVYRQKAIREWWSNPHYNRPAGVESGTATGWVAGSKPIRFIEMGCPAVDKGANQPNVFPDPKSSESFYPYFSTGRRDDQMQRAYLEAMIGFYSVPANNPESGAYGGRMLDLAHSNVWCWDVRPTPSYPLNQKWGDWSNWETGHWVSTRMGNVPGKEGLEWLMDQVGFDRHAIEYLPGTVDGITLADISAPREAIEALQSVFLFDAVESDGVIKFIARPGRPAVAALSADDLVSGQDGAPYRLTRSQESELPAAVKLRFGDWTREDQQGQAEARRPNTTSRRILQASPPVTMAIARGRQIAEDELRAAWIARERASFVLPPSRFALDPGDVVELHARPSHPAMVLRLASLGQQTTRPAEAFAVETSTIGGATITPEAFTYPEPEAVLDAVPLLVDGPLISDADPEHAGYLAGAMKPWGAGMRVYRSASESGFLLDSQLVRSARMGVTTSGFWSGPVGRWDLVNTLRVQLFDGVLTSADQAAVLNGANAMLVDNGLSEWELVQFTSAQLTGPRTYALRGLLRGQRGTEKAMRNPVPAGARVVMVDKGLVSTNLPPELVDIELIWRGGPLTQDIGGPGYQQVTHTMTGKARRPLAPCQLRGRRDPVTGDWTISWVRRTRKGGDNWAALDVPLAEAEEAYQLEILDGPDGDVVRSFAPSEPSQTYSAAQQTSDFGAPVYDFTARIAQVSDTWGPGLFHEALIWVR